MQSKKNKTGDLRLCVSVVDRIRFGAMFHLTVASFEIRKVFPEVVSWTLLFVCVHQLLFDFGSHRGNPPSSPLAFSLLVFLFFFLVERGKANKPVPERPRLFIHSRPHACTHTQKAGTGSHFSPPVCWGGREMDFKSIQETSTRVQIASRNFLATQLQANQAV